jgi:hypothetical protein
MLKAHLFDVPINGRVFKVIVSPHPLEDRADVDLQDDVIWIDPREPVSRHAELACHAVALAAQAVCQLQIVHLDD